MAKSGLSKTVSIYVNGKQVDSTLKSLQAELAKLRNHQRLCEIGSEDYIQTSLKMREIKTVIDEQRKALEGMEERTKSIGGTAKETLDKINKGLRNLGLQDLGTPDNWIKSAASMSDAYAAVQKTTGLTKEEVKRLNEEFKKMDTRTSRMELNQLASEAGKLGITGVESVQSFVDAADKIGVALGDELGNGAMVTMGKLASVYGGTTEQLSIASDDLGQQMLKIGSAINSLGAASSASEGHMVDFLNRMGGIATTAGLSAGDVLGFASALDQANISMESSSTAMSKLILQIFKKPEEFASAAGMAVEDFTDLALTDMNAALIQFFGNLKGAEMDEMVQKLTDMGMTGAGASQMLTTLTQNIGAITDAQQLANEQLSVGSSISAEFDTVNNTLAARLEKLNNQVAEVGVTIAEAFMPVLETTADTLTGIAGIASRLINFIKDNAIALGILTSATTTLILIKSKEKILLAAEKIHLVASTAATIAQTVATGGLTAATHALNVALRANPFGAVFAAIGLVVGIVTTLIKKFKQLKGESQSSAASQTASSKRTQQNLQAEMEKHQQMERQQQEAEEARKKRAKEQKKRHEEYMKQLEAQHKALEKADQLIHRLGSPKMDGMAESIAKVNDEVKKAQRELLKEYKAQSADALPDEAMDRFLKLQTAGLAKVHNEAAALIKKNREQIETWEASTRKSAGQAADSLVSGFEAAEKKMREMDNQVQQWADDAAAMRSIDPDQAKALDQQVEKYKALREQMRAMLQTKAMQTAAGQRQAVDASGFTETNEDGGAEATYLRTLRQINDEHQKLSSRIAEETRQSEALLDALRQQKAAAATPEAAAAIESEIEATQRHIDTLHDEAAAIDEARRKKEQLADNKRVMDAFKEMAEGVKSVTDKMMDAFSSISQIMDNLSEQEIKQATERHDKEVALLDDQLEQGIISQEQYNERKTALDEQLAEKEKEAEIEQFERQKLMNIAQAAINGALAIMNVWATTPTPAAPAMSAVVAALTALQIAAIASEPAPYARGGYVNRRTVYQAGERGREWVASNELLRNPETAGVIEWLEAVQRRRVKPSESVPMARANMPAATAAARQIAERQRPMRQAAAVADASRGELLDEFRMLRQYMEDPRNRQAVISRQTQLRFDEQENFLRQRARI